MPALPPEPPHAQPAPDSRPLPDPAAIRLCAIPDPAPPYDAEEDSPGTHVLPVAAGAGPLQPDVLPVGPGAAPVERHVVPLRTQARPAGAAVWPSRFAQVLAETLAGSRPPRQIRSWTTEQARTSIARLGPRMSSAQQPQLRKVVTSRPAIGVVEMAVVVGFGQRVHAVAVRFEQADRAGPAQGRPAWAGGKPATSHEHPRWLCTAVEAA